MRVSERVAGARRASYILLCATPFLVIGVVAVRALRIPGVYHVIGGVLFAAIAIAAWTLGARAIAADGQDRRRLGIAGILLAVPFALMALLWVGLGPPWEASATENRMRYLVLAAMAIAVAGGFVVLREALSEAGERLYSTLGFAATLLAGPLYLVWLAFAIGAYVAKVRDGQAPDSIVSLNDVLDILLFLAGAMTYLATAAFAAALGRTQWLGRGAAGTFVTVNFVALLFLSLRGLQFPDPRALAEPWYASPGFVAGIPAVPFIMPFLLGVVLLRRAGDERPS